MTAVVRPSLAKTKTNHIHLGGIVISDDLDNELAKFYETHRKGETLFLDFGDAQFIDIAVLANVVALILDRSEKGWATYMGYPQSKRVRDYLDVWNFPQAVFQATGIVLRKYLFPGQAPYLDEIQTTYAGIGDGIDALEFNPDHRHYQDPPDRKENRRNFFGFSSFSAGGNSTIRPEGPLSSVPRIESKKWTGTIIKEVLDKHLGNDTPQGDFARVVIYEAMSNAVRHPEARVIQVASLFTRKKLMPDDHRISELTNKEQMQFHNVEGKLRICIWDDGIGIASTLSVPLKAGKKVRISTPPTFMCDRTHVSVRRFEGNEIRHFSHNEHDDPNNESSDSDLLLASFDPGVTRTASQQVADVEAYCESPSGVETNISGKILPGMGLYALKRTVVDQFQGKIVLRSQNYRLVIESAKEKRYRYSCKITEYPERYPFFRGNLLVMQLPIVNK